MRWRAIGLLAGGGLRAARRALGDAPPPAAADGAGGIFTCSPLLAADLNLTLQTQRPLKPREMQCWLDYCEDDDALEVTFQGGGVAKTEKPFRIDFCSPQQAVRQGQAGSELVVKAMGKATHVIDMTAGLGRDALVLAAAGKTVLCYEENPVLRALLADALRRLRDHRPALASRVSLLGGRAQDGDEALGVAREVVAVYLDPMYPTAPADRRALVKKETQVLHRVLALSGLADAGNDRALLQAARRRGGRVVVKRDLRDPPLCGLTPHAQVLGSKQRFDVYFSAQLAEAVA